MRRRATQVDLLGLGWILEQMVYDPSTHFSSPEDSVDISRMTDQLLVWELAQLWVYKPGVKTQA